MSNDRRLHFSPRQAEIMRLIAADRSDKQIASDLGVSPRTVRTHLEKIYQQRGIKSRASAVSEWLREQHERQSSRPPDECPYPRPFPEGFEECPAYQKRELVALDFSDHPLAAVFTCRHLGTNQLPDTQGRWYGNCQLGDAAARLEWVNAVGTKRLQKIGLLQKEMSALIGSFLPAIWALKGLQLQKLHMQEDPTRPTNRMRVLAARFMRQAEIFLKRREPVLHELGVPIDAVMEVIRVSIDRLIAEPSADPCWQIPQAVLERFPPEFQLFLVPSKSREARVADANHKREVLPSAHMVAKP